MLTPPQSRCFYSQTVQIFFTKNITKRPGETARLHQENGGQYGYRHKHRSLKLQLHDAIYRLRFYSISFIHILSLSNSHNNVASIQKNRAINRTV